MNKFNKFGLSLATIAILGMGFTGCDSDSDNDSDSDKPTSMPSGQTNLDAGTTETPTESSKTPTDVTVERGKVYNATVKDSSEPAQVATQKNGENIYTFADTPIYPIIVTDGWIDVDGDGEKSEGDMELNMEMKSYSDTVTPISTYLAEETDEAKREAKLNELLSSLGIDGLTEEELLALPSETSIEAQIAINAVYGEMIESDFNNEDFNLNDLGETVSELDGLYFNPDLSESDIAIAMETYLLEESNLKNVFEDSMISEADISSYMNNNENPYTDNPEALAPVASINELLDQTFYAIELDGEDSSYSKFTIPSSFTVDSIDDENPSDKDYYLEDAQWVEDSEDDSYDDDDDDYSYEDSTEKVSVSNDKLEIISSYTETYTDDNGDTTTETGTDEVIISIVEENNDYLVIQYEINETSEDSEGNIESDSFIETQKFYFEPTVEMLDPSLIDTTNSYYSKSKVTKVETSKERASKRVATIINKLFNK